MTDDDVVDWQEDAIVAKVGSTRLVELASGERVRFAREALESVIQHVTTRFIPMNVERLTGRPASLLEASLA
jgi:hypothetical protein